jgi:hypothetical protein
MMETRWVRRGRKIGENAQAVNLQAPKIREDGKTTAVYGAGLARQALKVKAKCS